MMRLRVPATLHFPLGRSSVSSLWVTVYVFLLIASIAPALFSQEKPEDPVYFPDMHLVRFLNPEDGFANGMGITLHSRDQGLSWEKIGVLAPPELLFAKAADNERLTSITSSGKLPLDGAALHGIANAGPKTFICGDNGFIARSFDNERTWERLASNTRAALRGLAFMDEGFGFAVGDSGTILRTMDGGDSWVAMTRKNGRIGGWRIFHGIVFPAPWYYAALGLILVFMIPAFFTKRDLKYVESIEQRMVSDRPLREGDPDPLHFHRLSLGLSAFIRNPSTRPPLTIGIMGEWGSGKSSLMNLLCTDLKRYGLPTVWFNAWHHQNEQSILAALLESIRKQAIPALFSLSGIAFRSRLLFMRFKSYFWWAVLAVIASVFFFGYAGFPSLRDPAGLITDLCVALVKATSRVSGGQAEMLAGEVAKHLPGELPLLMYLSVLITTVTFIGKRLKAFGINPAALLAAFKKNASFQDLQSMAGFRQRFANELREVTNALGNNNLVVIVDDLDRCTPQNVLTVLEFINFLVTSGDLFVVMGINEKFVKSCVGLGMKDIAEEYAGYKELEKRAVPAPGNDANGSPHDALQIRSEFAQNYLEKLINVKIQVPLATTDQLCAIAREERSEEEELFSLLRVRDRIEAFGRWIPAAAIMLALVAGAYFGGRSASGCISKARETVLAETFPGPAAGSSDSGAMAPRQEALAERMAAVRGRPAFPDTAMVYATKPAWVGAGVSGAPPYWFAYALVLLTLLAVVFRIALRIAEVPRDSRAFKSALEEWVPLVECLTPTPRGIKKFINSVRYMAMFQRSYLPSPLVELSRGNHWIYRWALGIAGIKREIKPEKYAAHEPVPDDVLVGLSALNFCAPGAFGEEGEINIKDAMLRLNDPEFSRVPKNTVGRIHDHIENWNKSDTAVRYMGLIRGKSEKKKTSSSA
jgi:hypothetical protein